MLRSRGKRGKKGQRQGKELRKVISREENEGRVCEGMLRGEESSFKEKRSVWLCLKQKEKLEDINCNKEENNIKCYVEK